MQDGDGEKHDMGTPLVSSLMALECLTLLVAMDCNATPDTPDKEIRDAIATLLLRLSSTLLVNVNLLTKEMGRHPAEEKAPDDPIDIVADIIKKAQAAHDDHN